MKKGLEIYFKDFGEEMQKKILEFYGLNSPEEANLYMFPLFVLPKPDED